MGASSESDGSTAQTIQYDVVGAPLTFPFTLCAWLNTDTTSSIQSALCLCQSTTSNRSFKIGQFAGNFVAGQISRYAVGATSVSTGVWYYVCGVFRANNDREVFVNAVSDGTDAATASPVAATNVAIHIGTILSFTQKWNGKVAYPDVFNSELTTDEMKELMYKPYSINTGLICRPFNMKDGSVTADFKDLSPDNLTPILPATASVPTISTDGPPVTLPQMQVS